MDKKLTEKLKNILLALLIGAMIFAIYLNWPEHMENLKFSDFLSLSNSEESSEDSFELVDVLDIKKIEHVQKNGNLKYANSSKEVLAFVLQEIQSFTKTYETQIFEVNKEGYIEAKEEFESISIYFGIELPFSEFVESAGLGRGRDYDSISSFDEICFSAAYENSIYLRNSKEDKIYRLAASNASEDINIIEKLSEKLSYKETEYRRAEEIFGKGSAYIPKSSNLSLGTVNVEIKSYTDYEAELLARNIFGKSFDFARKVVDIYGAISYNYNYGEKVLKIYNGEIKYESTQRKSGNKSVFADIFEAKAFLEDSGLLSGGEISYRLEGLTEETVDGNKHRILSFVACVNGIDIYSEDKPIVLTIEMQNGTVVSLSMESLRYVSLTSRESLTPRDAARLVIENSKEIYKNIKGSEASSSDEAVDFVCENIESIELVYQRNGQTLLVPYWKINIANTVLYYGYY